MRNVFVYVLALSALIGLASASSYSSDSGCCCSSGFILLSLIGAVLMAKR